MKTITFLGRALVLRLTLLLFVAFATTSTFAQQDAPPTCVIMAVNPAITCPNSVVTATATVADIITTQPATWIIDPNLSGAYFVDNGLTSLAVSITANGNYSTTINVGPNAGSGFTVVLTFDNYPGLGTCSASPLVKAPTADAGIDNATCFNGGVNQIQLSGSASLGTAPYTYEWTDGPIGFLSNVNIANPILTNAPVGVHTFTLTVTDANGCQDTDTVVLTIYADPTADAGPDNATCYNEGVNQLQLSGSASGGTSPYTYEWTDGPIGFLSNVNIANPILTNAPVGVHTFTLTVTDANGCQDTDTVVLTIYANPTCIASNNGPVCEGDSVGLSVIGSNGTPPYTYLWTSDGAATFNDATLQNPTASGVVNGEIFTVTITDANGCKSTCTTTVIVEPCADEGCTLGYWKTHTDRWCATYRTCDRFGDVFINAPSTLANLTLLQALNIGGGGINNLARQAVAALLNACSDEVAYAGYSDDPQLVINAVNAAYLTGGNAPGMLASQLDVFNNSGCPLGGTKATSASNCVIQKAAVVEESAVIDSSVDFKVYPVPYADIINVSYRFEYDTDVTIQVFNLQGRLIHGVVDNRYNNGEVAVKQINLPRNIDQALIVRLTTHKEKLNKTIVAKSNTQR
jgi:hypothetical protein